MVFYCLYVSIFITFIFVVLYLLYTRKCKTATVYVINLYKVHSIKMKISFPTVVNLQIFGSLKILNSYRQNMGVTNI